MPPTAPSPAPTASTVRGHLGVIDVGSNAIRLQVARVFLDATFRVVHDEREPVRLGEEVFRTGVLSAAAVARALETLLRFRDTARKHGATSVRAVATSAVREAANGAAFSQQVEQATGFPLEVISGYREAQLIARGVLSCIGPPRRRLGLVDIGGGSTELSIVERGELAFSTSLPLGSVRLTELFCKSDPLTAQDERAMREAVRARLHVDLEAHRLPPCTTLVGSAGTIGALANFIHRRPCASRRGGSRTRFSVEDLREAGAALRRMSLAERQVSPGIEERRSEIVVAGAILLEEICARLHTRAVRLARRGLRDGLMLEEIEKRSTVDGEWSTIEAPRTSDVQKAS